MKIIINDHQAHSLIFCLIISSLVLISHSCLHSQSFILLQFKQEFNSNSSKTENWTAGRDCCSWDGVECDGAGRVLGLDLSSSSLQGPLRPNSSLFGLAHLRRLNLAGNDFGFSTIPPGFGRLSRLTNLSLSQSMFSGQIPREISWLKDLVSLDLSGVDYTDAAPLALGKEAMRGLIRNATSLRELSLNAVDLSSLDAEAFGNFSTLETLSLSTCRLSGRFPSNIFQLRYLRAIDVESNDQLAGSLPEFPYDSKLESLDLSSTRFSGELSESVGNLKSLETLKLKKCNFSGTIPTSLGNLSRLAALDLSDNRFSGEIPSSLGRLARLESLYASNNELTGKIPSSLGNLTRLTDLQLSNNGFTGEFPVSLANLTKLELFAISNNKLSGLVPDDPSKISNSQSLGSLDLSHNFFNGTIPSSFFTMPSLTFLKLDSNEFTGPLTIRNVSSSQLSLLYLTRNKLTGEIPSSISELTSLADLRLGANNLTGRVDFGVFSKLTSLYLLELSYNNLSITYTEPDSTLPSLETLGLASCNIAEFPKFLETQTELSSLDLTNNMIKGKIPKWLFSTGAETLSRLYLSNNLISGWEQEPPVLPWNNLNYLDLSGNRLRGSLVLPPVSIVHYFVSDNFLTSEIDPSFCGLAGLKVLDVSNNSMTGEVPRCLGLNSTLSMLNLKRNGFHGHVPPVCTQGSALKTLDLSHNKLSGKLPGTLSKCRGLEVLNIGYNRISDEFPFWTQTLPRLQVLVLRDNDFHGSIWRPGGESSGFDQLRIIDLSFNGFTGNLPRNYFENWTAINSEIPSENKSKTRYMGDPDDYYQDSMTLLNKGLSVSYERILTTLMAIDLSNNRFYGEIPSSIGDLKSLVVLNLSSNGFEGPIPKAAGNLNELESLDLSKNRLSGEIPRQLVSLTFLAYLNLSENDLRGQILQGGQWNTFPNSSYGGNEGLCGFPLTKKCGNGEPTKSLDRAKERESESETGFDWGAMAIGCGCGLVTGLIVEHVAALRRPNWLAWLYGSIRQM